MDLNWQQVGMEATAVALMQAAFSADRRAGAAAGEAVDRVAARVERRWQRLGWGNTSYIHPRRSRKGANEPTAYLIVGGGAAWQEGGTSRHAPRPTVRPEVDSEQGRLDRKMADSMIDGIL